MSTGKYQDPCRKGFREKRGQLQGMRYKYGDFEVWEAIPDTLPDGRVMRSIGEQVELDGGTYVVVELTESGALCESATKTTVQYTADGGKEVKFTATRRGYIHVGTYRERTKRRRTGRKGLLRRPALAYRGNRS